MQPKFLLLICGFLLQAFFLYSGSATQSRQVGETRLSARRRRTHSKRTFVDRRVVAASGRDPPSVGHQTDERHALHDFDINDEVEVAREVRRLQTTSDHEDVPTDTEPADAEIQADWEHDFEILKPMIASRGFDTSGATRLCELHGVYCDYGFRRRTPTYASALLDEDWVGKEYQIILDVVNESFPTPFNEEMFSLRRATFLSVQVNTGTMPAGIENMPKLGMTWIRGTGTAGLTGGLPDGFWNVKTRMFVLALMPVEFTGALAPDIGMCDYADFRFYTYSNPGMTGDIGHLKSCSKLESVIEVLSTAVYGNAWEVVLNMPKIQHVYDLTLSAFSGQIPNTEVDDPATDPWTLWCQQKSSLHLAVGQEVNGQLPEGLAACSNIFNYFDVSSSKLTGPFPMNFSSNAELESEAIKLSDNAFSGPIPDVPPNTVAVSIANNRWSGDIPASWWKAESLKVLDLSGCNMEGAIPSLTPHMKEVDLSNNRFSGYLPDSWKDATDLEIIDLSNNKLTGPIIPWAWQGSDFKKGAQPDSTVEVYLEPPTWPLKSITLNDNPMGISIGFLLSMLARYSLTEIYASNCSLMGFASYLDFTPNIPLASGGLAAADGVHLTKLRTLDLSENPDITSFGYMVEPPITNGCWVSDWDALLSNLKELSFTNCQGLTMLPNKAYSLSALYLDGTDSLRPPPVQENSTVCSGLYGTSDPLCDDGSSLACLYLLPVYASASEHRECGELAVSLESGSHPQVVVDSTAFAPDVLCRCAAGYEWEKLGWSCKACTAGTYATSEMTSCAKCPENSDSSPGAERITDCSCAAGLFLSNEVCEKCPEGTYSVVEGAVSIQVCIACSGGTVTAGQGSNSSDACQCPPGLTKENGVCVECAVGRFKNWLGDEECQLCPSNQGVQLTTLSTESIEESQCVCPANTYIPLSSTACAPCPEGMSCSIANSSEAAIGDEELPYPQASVGYMTIVEEPMQVYKCWKEIWCPGGAPGTCNYGRDPLSVGCGQCPEGTYTSPNEDCYPCKSSLAGFYMVIAVVGGVIALGLLAFAVNKQPATEPKSVTTVVIVSALTLTAVQNLGMLSSMPFVWVEPVRSILKVMSLMSFDLDMLQVECMIGQSPARAYGIRQLVAPLCSAYIVFVIILRSRFDRSVRVVLESTNAVGAVFQAFFISILVSVTLPFVCYSHPGDSGASMTSNPSIMCFSNSEHTLLIILGSLSFLAVACPFIVLVAYATLRYRSATADSSTAMRHLSLFRFLFGRFRPETYYYGCIALGRSCFICLLPVVVRDAPAAQIQIISMIFMATLLLQLYLQPWRSAVANLVDAGVSSFMVMLLISVALVGTYDDASVVAGVTGSVALISMLLLALAAMLHGVINRMIPSPFYQKFVCHHKADAAGQARFLQMMIHQRLNETCFIDSDDLSNLDDLLDTVRCRIGCLVVYLTADTLRRPWCAAEVTTTSITHRRAARVMTASFQIPTLAALAPENIRDYIHQSDTNLDELGIYPESLSSGFRWLLFSEEEVPEVIMSKSLVGLARFQQVVDDLSKFGRLSMMRLALGRENSTNSRLRPSRTSTPVSVGRSEQDETENLGPGMLVISSKPHDDEATAAAGILVAKIRTSVVTQFKAGVCILANLPDSAFDSALQVVRSAKAVIVILSQGSLQCEAQLVAALTAVQVANSSHSLEVIPVFTPDFRFNETKLFPSSKAAAEIIDAEQLLHSFFKRIAISIATHASDSVLDAQCRDVASRLNSIRTTTRGTTRGSVQKEMSVAAKSSEALNVDMDVNDHVLQPADDEAEQNLEPPPPLGPDEQGPGENHHHDDGDHHDHHRGAQPLEDPDVELAMADDVIHDTELASKIV